MFGGLFCLTTKQTSNVFADDSKSYNISASGTYMITDNKGYKTTSTISKTMAFQSDTIGKLGISGVEAQGTYDGVAGYSIVNSSGASLKYTLSFSKDGINRTAWNLSSDSAKSVNGISLKNSSVGKGAVILEKKPIGQDGYSIVFKEGNVFNSKDNFETTSLDGEDINCGCYYRLSVAYEIYKTNRVKKGWWIFARWVNENEYKNCLEVYNFFVGRNSCNIQLLDLTEKDYSSYATDESQINLIKKGDTLQNGSVTSAGFKVDYLENKSYKVQYSRNNGSYEKADDGLELKQNGKYVVRVTSLFGNVKETTIYVYNGGADKGYATYFGDSIFAGKRIADLSATLPTYQTGVKLHFNGVGANIPLLRGEIINQTTNVVTKIEPSQNEQNITLNAEGVYYASLTNGDTNLAGTYYTYEFAFIVSNQSTYPSINRNNLLNSYSVSDYKTKHVEVKYTMDSGKTAYICFAESDYDLAYQFAYSVEKKYITKTDEGYLYNDVLYVDNILLVQAINSTIETKLSYCYFTKALDNFYIDNENLRSSINLDNLNYDKDIYVSTTISLGKMLNRQNIVDGNFRFSQIGEYESKNIIAKNVDTGKTFNLAYNIKLEKMLKESGRYLITETNTYGESVTYQIVYQNTNNTVIGLDVDDTNVEINKDNYQVIKGSNIKINSIANALDNDGVVVITNLSTKEVVFNNYEEFLSKEFTSDSYLISVFDRSGNVYSFILNLDGSEFDSISSAIDLVKLNNEQIYSYILAHGNNNIKNVYVEEVE
jgi:nucleoside-triphosphatase THEP1